MDEDEHQESIALEEKVPERISAVHARAEKGEVSAQLLLAERFEKGVMEEKDMAAAIGWYSRAAAQDNVKALCKLAEFHVKGTGVEKSLAQAVHFYQRALAAASSARQTRKLKSQVRKIPHTSFKVVGDKICMIFRDGTMLPVNWTTPITPMPRNKSRKAALKNNAR